MTQDQLIAIVDLCKHYEVETSIFDEIENFQILEIVTISNKKYLNREHLNDVEKIIRLNRDLDINMEGIDVIFNLLKKVERLQNDMSELKNRLQIYEDL
ncbi:MAG: MerR family transcriptional regulator [Bacteroidetes bacterium]|nr:MAG: MerR family transcriptional regulator [Bacteroidota bacterium]